MNDILSKITQQPLMTYFPEVPPPSVSVYSVILRNIYWLIQLSIFILDETNNQCESARLKIAPILITSTSKKVYEMC